MPIVESLVKMNIAASLTAAAVLTVKYVLERLGLPRRILFLLWLLIAFRLVCPTAPQSRLSVMNLFTRETAVEYADKTDKIAAEQSAAVGPDKTSAPPDAIAVIWLFGAAVMLARGAVSYARLKRRLRFAVRYEGNVYFADNIPTAFVLGVLRPKIYIPSGTERLEYIIAHERTHIRRLDHISKLLAYALLSFNWLNPMNWLLFRLFSDDIELACDECVTARLDAAGRREYMTSLLDAAAGKNGNIPYHVCFSENITKRRIKAMLRIKKSSAPVIAAAVICCLAAGAAFGTSAVTAERPPAIYSTEPSASPVPTDAPYAVLSAMDSPEAEPEDEGENPADKSMEMPDVSYIEPVPNYADITTDADDGEADEENSGDAVPAMRMPDIEDMPEPTERGFVHVESETNTVYETDNPEPEDDAPAEGTTDVYTSGSVSRDDVTGIEMGTSREDVYSALGVDELYAGSAREEYSLDGGGTAVIIFDENDQLTRGYIAEGE